MSETQALTTTSQATAVATAQRAASPTAAATVRTVEAILRPAGARDLIQSGPLTGYSRSMVDAVARSVAKGAPDEELYRFFVQAIRYNLDPMAREIWCINTAGDGKPPQWQVTPSRDGLRRAARRNPHVEDVRSGLVRDGDDFTMDGEAGTYVHKARITAKKGAILGAYCQIVLAGGLKHVEFFYLDEVKRQTSVWTQFPDRMVVAAAERTMIKRHAGVSDLYIEDVAFERISEMETALLVDPTKPDYVDGFAIGTVAVAPPAQIAEPTGPSRESRTDGVKALTDRIVEIARTVEGAEQADAIDARIAWLTAVVGHGALGKITEPQDVWDLVDLLESEDGTDHFSQLLTEARGARWQKEATAREYAEAGQAPPATSATAETAIDVEAVNAGDDIPPFDAEPTAGSEVTP